MVRCIPAPSLRRLPLYYRELRLAMERGEPYISSLDLGSNAGVPAAQVRKDLSYLDEKGKSGVGYDAAFLAGILESYLGLASLKQAAMVGVGNLGRALALYPGFAAYKMEIVVLFDSDPDVVGTEVGGKEVLPVEKLTTAVACMRLRIGIITTPPEAAQDVADAMVAGGIKAIWNFAPRNLDVPDDVFVKNEDLGASLAVLSHALGPVNAADAVAGLPDEI